MPLTQLQFDPSEIYQNVRLGAGRTLGFISPVTVSGDDVFADATLSTFTALGGQPSWLIHPPTCNPGVPFTLTFNPKLLRNGRNVETLQVQSGAVTATLEITAIKTGDDPAPGVVAGVPG